MKVQYEFWYELNMKTNHEKKVDLIFVNCKLTLILIMIYNISLSRQAI